MDAFTVLLSATLLSSVNRNRHPSNSSRYGKRKERRERKGVQSRRNRQREANVGRNKKKMKDQKFAARKGRKGGLVKRSETKNVCF